VAIGIVPPGDSIQAAFQRERMGTWTRSSAWWEAELSLHWSLDRERTTALSPASEGNGKEWMPRIDLFHVYQLSYLLKLVCIGPGQNHEVALSSLW